MSRIIVDRLFFAIRPPLAVARRIAAMYASLDARLLPADRLHLTMFILDDCHGVDPALVDRMTAIGAALRVPPVAITLDRLVASPRSIALRPSAACAGLGALHAALADLARRAGVAERRDYRFGAHMTLGYRDGMPSSRPVAPVRWVADELVLIHSHVGLTRHVPLASWPLLPEPEAQLSLL